MPEVKNSSSRVQIQPQTLTSCMTLGKSLYPVGLSFLICKMSWSRKWQTTPGSLLRKSQMGSQRVGNHWSITKWRDGLEQWFLNFLISLHSLKKWSSIPHSFCSCGLSIVTMLEIKTDEILKYVLIHLIMVALQHLNIINVFVKYIFQNKSI